MVIPDEGVPIDVPGFKVAGTSGGSKYNFGGLSVLDFDCVHDEPLIIVGVISLFIGQGLLHFNNIVVLFYSS